MPTEVVRKAKELFDAELDAAVKKIKEKWKKRFGLRNRQPDPTTNKRVKGNGSWRDSVQH